MRACGPQKIFSPPTLWRLRRHRVGGEQSVGRAAPHTPPFSTRVYRFAVIAQVVAIPLVSRLLIVVGYPDAIISAIAVIVGLHFFGLIPAFQSWRFAAVGGTMILLGVSS